MQMKSEIAALWWGNSAIIVGAFGAMWTFVIGLWGLTLIGIALFVFGVVVLVKAFKRHQLGDKSLMEWGLEAVYGEQHHKSS